MIEISGEINHYMPQYVVERAYRILNRFRKSLNGSKILILGVAYKQDIDDFRESLALKVMENFEKEGAFVQYNDPYIPCFKNKDKEYRSTELSKENLNESDLIILPLHKSYNYDFIQANSTFILDTKNAMKNLKKRNNIELL